MVASHALMLFACGLFLQGSWAQAVINLHVKMPVTGISMALFYGVGVVFSVSVGLILLHDLYRALTGRLAADELVTVRETEDAAVLQQHAAPAAAPPARLLATTAR